LLKGIPKLELTRLSLQVETQEWANNGVICEKAIQKLTCER